MQQRDYHGRYRRVRVTTRWEYIVCLSILGGITLGILLDVQKEKPIELINRVEAATTTPKEIPVLIEVEYGPEGRERYIRSVFIDDTETAVKVYRAESVSGTQLVNPEGHYRKDGTLICRGSYGAFQLSCEHYLKDIQKLKEFEFNVQKAHEIYKQSGWYPWGVCHDGKVNCRLK